MLKWFYWITVILTALIWAALLSATNRWGVG